MSGKDAAPIPGTAVAPRRPTLDEVIAATARPVPPVPGQCDLVDYWRESGVIDDDHAVALGGEQS
ncbi:hypothetical protein [Streptomyces sp. C1-2]|uniref:hypothetical protein n=1 Tax=Streptomyces sp. C1-2 TaxID=2720022 RepID=UPI00143256A2|nr:hypothetical protein [Streptomyces sp. C1-2]NJP71926.1 hypothetical protein [Streptomyces sp. C1-2]